MPKTSAVKPKYQTRCERFLSEMEQVVPWQALLEPSYPMRRASADRPGADVADELRATVVRAGLRSDGRGVQRITEITHLRLGAV